MMILVTDVPESYKILLGHNFCKDAGGELNMDMSKEKLIVKGVMHKLLSRR